MKQKIFFFLIFSCLGIYCQEIQIFPSISHLGKIPDTKPAKCKFEIYNSSSKKMKISHVHAFCSCNVATLESKEILPGEKKKLEVVFNPYGRNSGYLRWEIQIFHNLSSQPLLAKFDVLVLKDHYLSHHNLYLGEFPQGKRKEAKIWISPKNFPNFQIQKIDLEINADKKKCFDIVCQKEMYDGFYPEAREAYCLKIIAKKEIPATSIQGKIVLTTNFPKKAIIEIPLFAKVGGDIGINRSSLTLGILKKNKPREKSFMVYAVDENKPFEIKGIKSTLPFLSLKIETLVPGRYFQIHTKAMIKDSIAPGEFRGQIQISTSNPRQPLLILPVQGFIVPSFIDK